jgi:hypothetical protein
MRSRSTPPDLHLVEAVLRGYEALREEQVVFRLGVDVRDAPAVAADFDGFFQTGEGEAAFDLGQTGLRFFPQPLFGFDLGLLGARPGCDR